MLGEKYTLDIRPTFIDELDRQETASPTIICTITIVYDADIWYNGVISNLRRVGNAYI